jgi:hypothetical protein
MPVRGSGEIRLRTGLPDCLEIEPIKADFGAGGHRDHRRARAGRKEMKRIHAASVIVAAAVVGGWILTAPASAAPPTVTPSPGYDARLQEQRAARIYDAPPVYEPVVPTPRPPRHHAKRVHNSAHD